jgi:hypothetical protein
MFDSNLQWRKRYSNVGLLIGLLSGLNLDSIGKSRVRAIRINKHYPALLHSAVLQCTPISYYF